MADNIGFPLRMARLPRRSITEKVEAAARLLKIGDQLAKKPAQLSGGRRVLFRAPLFGQGVGEIPELDAVTHTVGRPGELTMTLTPARPQEVGERLRLRLDPDALHLFDRGGRAL